MQRWQALLDSPESSDERLLQTFLERHPSLLPGSDRHADHPKRPLAVLNETATMAGDRVPADWATMLLGMFRATRRGELATAGPEL